MPAATTVSVAASVAPSARSDGSAATTSVTAPSVASQTVLRVSGVVNSRTISAPTERMRTEMSAGEIMSVHQRGPVIGCETPTVSVNSRIAAMPSTDTRM